MKIANLNNQELNIMKLIKGTYSNVRDEIYINDIEDNQIFQINLWDNEEDYDYYKERYYIDAQFASDEVILQNIVEDYKDVIIAWYEANYEGTALENIAFNTFNILGFPDANDIDNLYCVYYDYIYQLVFAQDEEEALDKVMDMNAEYAEIGCEEEETLYNGVIEIKSK